MWSLRNVGDISPNQLIEPTRMMCFAAKFVGEPKMHFYSSHEHGQKRMVKAAHKLLDEAHVLLTYNGSRFDSLHLNREFLAAGLPPPSPYQQIDLCSVAQRKFRFISSKLAHVSVYLGLEGKVSHEGFDLWKKCLAGDAAAWKRMARYCKQDTRLNEELYNVLQPWITNHPSRPLHDGKGGCPNCGSDDLEKRGFYYTKVSVYQRFRCRSCKTWTRSNSRDAGVKIQGVAS